MFDCHVFDNNPIYSVIYFPDDLELTLTFSNNRQVIYSYYDVPTQIYQDLINHPNPSLFFNLNIRNSFTCHREG